MPVWPVAVRPSMVSPTVSLMANPALHQASRGSGTIRPARFGRQPVAVALKSKTFMPVLPARLLSSSPSPDHCSQLPAP